MFLWIGTFLTIDCDNISISFLNISNTQNKIYDFFIYTPIAISNLNISNLTNEGSPNYIIMTVNCSLNLSNSFISKISTKFLLSYLSQIIIINTIFFDNFLDYEPNLVGNGISLQMGSGFEIENSSFISLSQRNTGPVLINLWKINLKMFLGYWNR